MVIAHTYRRIVVLSLFCLYNGFGISCFAQEEPSFLAVVESKSSQVEELETTDKAAYYFRHYKKLSPTYQGYLIELVVSEAPLRRDNSLFKYFGNVYYQRLPNGKISYCLLGNDFGSRKNIKQFIKNVVKHQAPEAQLRYKKKL